MDSTKKITTLKIYNPDDFPFGALSNIAPHEMQIDSKRWKSVESYIRSNLLITPLYKLNIQNAPLKGTSKNTNIDEKIEQMIAVITTKQKRIVDLNEREQIRNLILSETAIQSMNIQQFPVFYK